jgi:hypothetical protein
LIDLASAVALGNECEHEQNNQIASLPYIICRSITKEMMPLVVIANFKVQAESYRPQARKAENNCR